MNFLLFFFSSYIFSSGLVNFGNSKKRFVAYRLAIFRGYLSLKEKTSFCSFMFFL